MKRNGSLLLCLIAALPLRAAELDLDDIKLPRGFAIEIYANVPEARSLTLGYNDVVFVYKLLKIVSIFNGSPRGDLTVFIC